MQQQSLFRPDTLHPYKSTWTPPARFPDLSSAKIISVDLETLDPDLKEKGCGSHRGTAYTAGIAVGTDDGFRGYFPIRHELGGNLDCKMVLRWAKEQLGRSNQIKIGANILYDMEMLGTDGIELAGEVYDIQYAEPLLDENRLSYSLDSIANHHLKEGKVSTELQKWEKAAYGTKGANIARCPVGLVGTYAEGDVDLPLRIWAKQQPLLEKQGLTDLFKMECSLLPLLLKMRQSGVRVDIAKAERLHASLSKKLADYQKLLNNRAGFFVNVDAAVSLGKLFDKLGIPYPRTEKTKAPSFVKGWLESMVGAAPEVELILQIRKFRVIIGTFLENAILNTHVNGRIYSNFHPLRSDEGGTVSGRFSSSAPNLQQIPSRDETMIEVDGVSMKLGNAIRSLFIPEDDCDWVKDDYSQVEFRILTHYGTGQSAEHARYLYKNDPKTDFHTMCATLCDIPRSPAKNINFGLAYNMGEQKLAASLNRPIEEARDLFKKYHENLPFVKDLQVACSNVASNRGYIRTLLNRRSRFDLWESRDWDSARAETPRPRPEAAKREALGANRGIRRAYTYKACNRLIQGSAADVMKAAMVKVWKSGVCNALGVPMLTVHDELDWSRPKTKVGKEAHDEVLNIMQTAVKLKVPLICDTESGPSWGEVK